jgi:organic hydroperoxide reductase OsmC/OhrA
MSAPQLFAAAMAACIAGFIANSCRLRGIPLARLEVQLTAPIQSGPRRVGDMEAVVRIEPEPPEEIRQHLLTVAKRATLLNTLARPPRVAIRFAPDPPAPPPPPEGSPE